jgi:hypothetical protein
MNVNGIASGLGGIRPPQTDPRTRAVQQQPGAVTPQAPHVTRAPGARGAAAPAAASNAVPVEAPEGTDPELWSVLTADERAFFAKVGAMGPLTYGHILANGRNDLPVARGGRLDVRA